MVDMNDIICQAIKQGEGTYIWDEATGRLVPVDIPRPVKEVEPDDEEIPFCDGDCENCEEYDEEMELDMEVTDPCFWGIPDIRRILFNPPATIVFWEDDTKTVVKCMDGEKFEKYAGFMAACMKKMFGSTSRAKAIMRECDREAVAAEKEAPTPNPEPASKPKSISVSDMIDAFAYAVASTVHAKEKEKENETPAE